MHSDGADVWDVVDDTADLELSEIGPPLQLDTSRIRQLAALRRGAIRARSWCWIAMVVAAAAAIQLLIKAGQNVWHAHGPTMRAAGFVLFAVLATVLSVAMWRNGRRLSGEINAPPPAGPETEPDFAPLSDGSQRWSNLENLR